MVERTQRSLAGARQMQKDLRQFHHLVRQWASDVPIGTNVYLGCDFLNYAIIMMDMQLTAALERIPYERPPGFQGLE